MLPETKLITILIAASPILELRGAIPYALAQGISTLESYWLSIFGNILPVIPLFFFYKVMFDVLQNVPLAGRFFHWWNRRIELKSDFVRTYGFIGLVMFVAIPFPTTGAWTGTLVAALLKFRFAKALCGIIIGIMIAGIIVTLTTKGILSGMDRFFTTSF
ncbi:MAG: small multi-drug export protein [Candidatus Omnitrophica bacterium]|nr:small multi-drug export protein [Candidatus Omnitrophota bacterium]